MKYYKWTNNLDISFEPAIGEVAGTELVCNYLKGVA